MPVIARGPPALGLREKPPQVATTRPGYVEPMGLGREDHARAATLRRLVAGAQHVRFASQTITTLLSSTVSVRKHREHAKMAVADADAPYRAATLRARAASGSDTAFTNPTFCDVTSRGALSCSSASEASILNVAVARPYTGGLPLCRWHASTTSTWSLSAFPKCNQASLDADSPSPAEHRVPERTS